MKTRILVAAALCFITLLFCSSLPVLAGEKVKLEFWHAMGGFREQILNRLVEKFNRENPDVEVEAVYVKSRDVRTGNDYHALYRKIMEGLAQKSAPCVAQVYENWAAQWIEIGALTPLGDGGKEGFTSQDMDDLVPVFREANTYDGKLWTMPFNKSIYVLYYNKDMFRKAGLNPPDTWEKFREAAGKLTVRKGDKVEVYGLAFRPSVDMFGHYLYAFGGDFILDGKAAFNTEVGIKDLQFWVDLVHKDLSALASFDDKEAFSDGKSAMYIETTSRIPGFIKEKKFEVGVALLPQGTTRKYQFAGTNLAVFSHLDPPRKKAAVRFVHFMTGRESTLFWAKNTGYLPVRRSAIESPEYQELLKSEPRYRVGVDALQYAKVQPKTAAWEMIRGIVDDAIFEAISQRETSPVALERASQMSDQLITNLTVQK